MTSKSILTLKSTIRRCSSWLSRSTGEVWRQGWCRKDRSTSSKHCSSRVSQPYYGTWWSKPEASSDTRSSCSGCAPRARRRSSAWAPDSGKRSVSTRQTIGWACFGPKKDSSSQSKTSSSRRLSSCTSWPCKWSMIQSSFGSSEWRIHWVRSICIWDANTGWSQHSLSSGSNYKPSRKVSSSLHKLGSLRISSRACLKRLSNMTSLGTPRKLWCCMWSRCRLTKRKHWGRRRERSDCGKKWSASRSRLLCRLSC